MFKRKKRQIIFLDLESVWPCDFAGRKCNFRQNRKKCVVWECVLFKKLWFEKRRKIRIFKLRARSCVLNLAGRPLRQGNSSMLKFAKEKCVSL